MTQKIKQIRSFILNSSHFDKLEHAHKFTKEILAAKNNLVYSTHFGLSERIRIFFQKFSNRKHQVLCAITLGGIGTHLKVVVAFKSQKFMFFTSKIEALLNPSKIMVFCDVKAAITFRCVAIPPKVIAHNTSSFLFLEVLKKTFKFAEISQTK